MQADHDAPKDEITVRIPSAEPNVEIAGILHRSNAAAPTKEIALILHGLMAHKNQSYHRQLANALPIDSFRFDFRGNGDTPGAWGMVNIAQDIEDLQAVVSYLRLALGYRIELIVGHSRGSLDSWTYLARDERLRWDDENEVPFLVAISGRWEMKRILDRLDIYQKGFKKEGVFRWKTKSDGKVREYPVYPSDLGRMASFPIQNIVRRLPPSTEVLLIHGTEDRTVPVQDVHSYLHQLQSDKRRQSSAQELQLVHGSDHMFKGYTQDVVNIITRWFDEKKETRNGRQARM